MLISPQVSKEARLLRIIPTSTLKPSLYYLRIVFKNRLKEAASHQTGTKRGFYKFQVIRHFEPLGMGIDKGHKNMKDPSTTGDETIWNDPRRSYKGTAYLYDHQKMKSN